MVDTHKLWQMINPMVHYDEHVDVRIVMVMVRNAAVNNMSVNVWLS